jgi:ubiquinone/menaquinone biosynthesis C-methylase UbiE
MTDPAGSSLQFDTLLSCVECGQAALERISDCFRCSACGTDYEIVDGVASFFRKEAAVTGQASDRMEFWNQGWNDTNSPFGTVGREDPAELREAFHSMLTAQRYPAVTWLSEETVRDRVLLNVGCGGGYEGVLFAGYGARYIGVDFSINAARSTRRLIDAANYTGTCYQCEAERLPLQDSTIDIIYTNGVLHHTPNTPDTLRELHRVLRPGARAIIALYATRSAAFYWYRTRAVLAGNFTKRSIESWVDRHTEGEWQTEGRENQHTRSYTRAEFRALIEQAGFEVIRIEQSQLQLGDIPVLSRVLAPILASKALRKCVAPFGMMLIADCRPNGK